jgi:hypothetical protein
MTSTIGRAAAAKTVERISGMQGVQASLAGLLREEAGDGAGMGEIQIRSGSLTAELAERVGQVKYPAMQVHCLKIVNDFREKFRTFSGRVWMGIEVRHSQDRVEGMEDRLHLNVDAVARTLDGARGDWGDGMFYAGGYEIEFGPVKQGGRHLIQSATVKFAVEVGR